MVATKGWIRHENAVLRCGVRVEITAGMEDIRESQRMEETGGATVAIVGIVNDLVAGLESR